MTHLSRLLALLGVLLVALIPSRAQADTVAVLYFENQGNPALEPLKVGLTQMLITDLQGTDGVTVVERSQLQALLDELELGHSGAVDPDTAAKVGNLLGAEWLVMGSYFEMMGTLRIDTRLVRVETGEIVHAHGVDGASNEFMRMESELATALQGELAKTASAPSAPSETGAPDGTRSGPGDGSQATAATVVQTEPEGVVLAPDPEALDAAVAFSEGLIYLDKKDVTRARESFEKAVAADPNLHAAQAELTAMEI
jgi:TolB-like protein